MAHPWRTAPSSIKVQEADLETLWEIIERKKESGWILVKEPERTSTDFVVEQKRQRKTVQGKRVSTYKPEYTGGEHYTAVMKWGGGDRR